MNLLGLIGGEGGQNLLGYMQTLSNLLAYYPMDEASGNMINRAPATYGTLNGTVSGAMQNVQGKTGRAYSFNGTDNFVTIGAIPFGTAGTIGLLVNFDIDSTNRYFFDSTATNRYLFYKRNDAGYGHYLNSNAIGDAAGTFTTIADDSTWTSIIFTWDSSLGSNKQAIYKNGVLLANANVSIAANTPNNFYVGMRNDSAQFYNGLMQHLFMMSRAMTAGEALKVAQLSGLA